MSKDFESRMASLHLTWEEILRAMIGEGAEPIEAVEAMLTVATASKLQLEGALRTAHASLLLVAGELRGYVVKEANTRKTTH